ncbi:MAG TPA: hypothetical protein VMF14_12820 [Solirubrobacteraceae bacterium]|nr:hypothetical protein [Solirubrobacteraceae bacterium]
MRTLLRTLTGAVAVAVVGFALARYGAAKSTAAPPPLDRQASVAGFRINYPSTWRVVSPATVPLLPLSDGVTLADSGSSSSRLIIGTQQTTTPSALPSGLAATLPPSTSPQVVTLGPNRFYRFLNLTPHGQTVAESIYTLPTSVGTVTAVCSSPTFTTRFTSSCERALSTIKLTAGDVLSIGVDPGYALQLNRILGQLNDVRRSDGAALRSNRVGTRARAASALARAHAQAATAAGHLSGEVSSANRALVTALQRNATAYSALAQAAAKNDVPAYGRAQAAVASAGSGLNAAFTELRQLGYTVR